MSIWKGNPNLEERIVELVTDGTFCNRGEGGVREILIGEFPDLESQLTPPSVRAKLAHIIWSDKRNRNRLEKLMGRAHLNGEEIRTLFPLIPEELVRSKLQRSKRKRGGYGFLQRVEALIKSPEELRLGLHLPITSLDDPFVIEVKDPRYPSIMAINAPQVGLVYQKAPKRNVFKNALILAQAKQCDAVLITGNIIHIDLKRASINKPYRSELSGMSVEPEVLEIMGGYNSAEKVKKLLEKDEIVFVTFRERFETLLRGLHKIFYDNGKPIFKGKVLITFGLNEEDLIHRAVFGELRARVAIERERLSFQIKTLRHERDAKKTSSKRREKLHAKIENLTARLKRTNMTNVSDETIRDMRDRIGAWVIQRLTKVVPNSEVIGIDEIFLSAGGKTIQVIQNPTDRTTDTYLGKVIANLRKETRRSDLADLVLLGGRSVLTRANAPIRYYAETRGSITADLEQLAMLLDRRFLVQVGKRMIKEGAPLLKLLNDEHFYTGAAVVQWVDGISRKELYSSEYLSRPDNFTKDSLRKLVEGDNIIYGHREGDKHEGHPWVIIYPTPEWPYWIRHDEACLELLERLNAPILWHMDLGDTVQGHHFPSEVENHPDWMRPDQLLKKLEALRAQGASFKKHAAELERAVLYDKTRGGMVRVEDQLQTYLERFIRIRFAPFAARMIIRARKTGFVTRGNLGVITLLSGNHFGNTFEGEMTESSWIRMRLVAEIYAYAVVNNLPLSREEIEDAVKAPMFGQEALAEGLFGIQRGSKTSPLYAVSARHKPVGGATKYADPVRKGREAFGKRGATNQALRGCWLIVLAGHTHMGGSTSTPYGDYRECGSQTDSDPYGERLAFPLNTISSEISGEHVDGPERGPRVEISLRDDLISSFVAEPWEINAKRLFANAIGWDE